MMKKIIAIILAALCFSNVSFAYDTGEVSDAYKYLDLILEIGSELYIDETITKEDILKMGLSKFLEDNPQYVEELLKQSFTSIDKYSDYYNFEDILNFYNDIEHTFYGIGVVIQKEGDYITVIRCLESGSAIDAGIQPGDKIIKVNGEDCIGKTIESVQKLIVGEEYTLVNVTVLRNGQELTYEVVRKAVSDTTVNYTILDGNVGYVEIINFASNTSGEFAECLAEMEQKGVEKIILDLRGNPGGYLVSAVEIGQMIVPKGVLVKTMYRQAESNETFYSELDKSKFEFAVLVNGGTASAAELLSAAIQESGIGVLIGETTYGKALIQELIPIGDGTAIKITTGKYLTRNGNDINLVGIEPDISIVNPERKINPENYTQFDYKTKWRTGMTGDGVVAAKERLYMLGYKITNLDNTYDGEVFDAVKKFQKDNGLFPYGVLDITTQVKMENLFAECKEKVDMQLIKAYQRFGGTEEQLFK